MKPSIDWKSFVVGVVLGAGLGALSVGMDQLIVAQDAYIDGRNSVLNSAVRVGPPASPCSVNVPLSVLAEMVSIGVTDWPSACLEAQQ
jgi:hypothetical protein